MSSGWRLVRLGDAATLQRGFDLPVQDRRPGRSPIYAANGRVGFHRTARVEGPGVVTGRSGSIGKVHYVEDDFWPLNTSLFVRDFHGNHPKYLYWLLRELKLERYCTGTGVPTLNRNIIHELKVPLPPVDEQRRIAAILDRASVLRQKPRAMLASLDDLIQAQFVDMFDGEYEQKPISDLCELLVDCVNRTAPTVDEETPYKMLRTTNVRHGRVNTTDVKFVSAETFARWNRRATPQRGDVILTREAPVGEAGILDSDDRVFLGQRLFLYRVDPKHLTPEFLRACFDSPHLRAQFDRLGSGSTVKHLPLPACQSFLIPAPPIEIQLKYSDYVRGVAKVAQSIRAASAKLDELLASLQSRAFSGRL